jgi:hypothetical protein
MDMDMGLCSASQMPSLQLDLDTKTDTSLQHVARSSMDVTLGPVRGELEH